MTNQLNETTETMNPIDTSTSVDITVSQNNSINDPTGLTVEGRIVNKLQPDHVLVEFLLNGQKTLGLMSAKQMSPLTAPRHQRFAALDPRKNPVPVTVTITSAPTSERRAEVSELAADQARVLNDQRATIGELLSVTVLDKSKVGVDVLLPNGELGFLHVMQLAGADHQQQQHRLNSLKVGDKFQAVVTERQQHSLRLNERETLRKICSNITHTEQKATVVGSYKGGFHIRLLEGEAKGLQGVLPFEQLPANPIDCKAQRRFAETLRPSNQLSVYVTWTKANNDGTAILHLTMPAGAYTARDTGSVLKGVVGRSNHEFLEVKFGDWSGVLTIADLTDEVLTKLHPGSGVRVYVRSIEDNIVYFEHVEKDDASKKISLDRKKRQEDNRQARRLLNSASAKLSGNGKKSK
jgi:hypothetical protein